MRVLVAHASERGGTAGLAEMIAEELRAAGVGAHAAAVTDPIELDHYDAAVVAGALYIGHWHADARRFVRDHRDWLRRHPVWLVSSGPLDDSAATTEIPPVHQVRKAMHDIDARGHVTFGGYLAPDAHGFMAHAMAQKVSGDWRDRDHVRRWVLSVAEELQRPAAA